MPPGTLPFAAERIQQMSELEPLGPKTYKKWRDLAWQIVQDWTKGNPPTHPIFNREPLSQLNRNEHESRKSTIWKDLDKAWRALGSAPVP